jgi:putative NADH-flavin reductase
LAGGHRVTAISRHASAQQARLAGKTAVSADILDVASVVAAVSGHDAVVTAVSGRAPGAGDTVSDAARVLLVALPRAGVTRLVFVGGGGSLNDASGRRFVDDPNFPEQHKQEALVAAEALEVFRTSEETLNWPYLSPPPMHLFDAEKTGTYRVQAGDDPLIDETGESRVALGDLASAVIDVLEDGNFSCERFTVGY